MELTKKLDVKNFKSQIKAGFDEKDMTISFVALSSNNLHKRIDFFGDEFYLSVNTRGVKFSAKTLYKDHFVSFDNAIGEIIDSKFEDGNIKVKVKFNKEVEASKEAFYKYKNNLSNSVSVGFGDIKLKECENIDGIPHYEISQGEVVELSAVWQGADKNAVISKFQKQNNQKGVKMKETTNEQNKEVEQKIEQKTGPKVNEVELKDAEIENIITLSQILNNPQAGLEAIKNKKSYKEFSEEMKNLNSSEKYQTINVVAKEKISDDFSLARIIRSTTDSKISLGSELNYGGKNGGFILPNSYISKFADVKTTTTTAVGMIENDFRGDLLIDIIKQDSELLSKATFIPSSNGTISIPRSNTKVTAAFVEEGATKDAEALNFDYINLNPHTLTATVEITRTMLNMTNFDLEAYAFRVIKDAIALKLEEEVLYGNGVVNGIFNVSGVPVIADYLTAPTLEKTLEFSTKLDDEGLPTKNSVFFFRGSDMNLLRSTVKSKSQDVYLLDGNDLQGYPALKNNILKKGNCVFGNFEDILIGTFGNLEVRVLPTRGGNIFLEGLYDVDMKLAREKSFVIGK
jgi:phage capsid family|nr:MAG TPA: major capsid protein [Bacteriophage sp.]